MAPNLSDRLIDSMTDMLDKMSQTDIVQKILMTGDLSGKHRAVMHRMYKDFVDLAPLSAKLFKDVLNMSGLTPEEKGFFQKLDEKMGPALVKYLDEMKAVVAPVPDEVMSAPAHPNVIIYHKLFSDPVTNGSVIKFMTTFMVGYAIPFEIYKYLKGNPSYKENDLAQLISMSSLGVEQALVAIKAFIDNRANEVTPELESELKDQIKKFCEFELDTTTMMYNET